MPRRKRPSCLICRDPAVTRGLCQACYQNARYAIRTGRTTEVELVEKRLLAPKGQAPTSEFRRTLAEALATPQRRKKTTECHESKSA